MLPRVLEPEVMDAESDAADYDAMDHSHVNRVFVADVLSVWCAGRTPNESAPTAFDAGTGTALIPIELLQQGWTGSVMAADAAPSMLELARRNVERAGYRDRIESVLRDCKAPPEAAGSFDLVMSNSIVHHIPQPAGVLSECWRILKPGGLLFVRDLFRPDDAATVDALVRQYAGNDNAHQQMLFRDSLHAALTVAEVQALIEPLDIPRSAVQATSDRHWTLSAWKRQAFLPSPAALGGRGAGGEGAFLSLLWDPKTERPEAPSPGFAQITAPAHLIVGLHK
ncbi:MAG: methyltransferase domain-containing protein [Planctomycetaceae bacterium]|nr:methyltransferase domain-containing protein [Planctomycetaceae bacterium]